MLVKDRYKRSPFAVTSENVNYEKSKKTYRPDWTIRKKMNQSNREDQYQGLRGI